MQTQNNEDKTPLGFPEPPVNKRLAMSLMEGWKEKLGAMPCPPYGTFARWLRWLDNDADAFRFAIERAADRLTRTPFQDAQHPQAYVSATAKRFHAERLRAAAQEAANKEVAA